MDGWMDVCLCISSLVRDLGVTCLPDDVPRDPHPPSGPLLFLSTATKTASGWSPGDKDPTKNGLGLLISC